MGVELPIRIEGAGVEETYALEELIGTEYKGTEPLVKTLVAGVE